LTVGELLAQITARFEQAGVPTPAVDAEWLVRHVTRWSRTRLVTNSGSEVGDDLVTALEPLVIRRAGREPLQLILGSVGFRYLDIEVRPGVFIPRPETEVLAGEAITRVPEGGVVVEPCTGTGAIACAVAQETNATTVIATDISDAAVDLAAANAKRADLPVTVLRGDLLAPVNLDLRGGVDLLVSNPPYLTPDDLEGGEPEVLDWDPLEALVAGPSGHEVTDRLIAAALEWLRPGGWLLLEVDSSRAAETAARAAGAGLRDARVLSDLTGTDRIVVARHPG
jgi:release factor glutamine methyltransferase